MTEAELPFLTTIVLLGGLALGFAFGAIGNRTNFCTMGAVSDIVVMGDWNRMRMWLLAVGIAILGTASLELLGIIKVANSIYTGARLVWLSHLIGGFLFGFGMVLGSGCGSKTLIRIGGGNLKSLVVAICLAIVASMTLRGLFAPLRIQVLDAAGILLAGPQDLPAIIARASGVSRIVLVGVLALLIGGGIVVFALRLKEFRASGYAWGSVAIGVIIVAGWALTGHVGFVPEHPATLQEAWLATNTGKMESLTFVGPHAYLLELGLLWTDQSRVVTFGIASLVGVVLGSAAYALATGTFRIEGFRQPEDLVNHMLAGVLMGFGGVTALGCTIGQGITGVSTLAVGSIITIVSIIAGAVAALKYQSWRFERQINVAESAA